MYKKIAIFSIYGLIILALFLVPTAIGLLVDWYWFKEIGHSDIFTTILSAKVLLGVGVGLVSFIIIYKSFWIAKRILGPSLIAVRFSSNQSNAQEVQIGKYLNKLILPVSLVIGFLTGLVGSGKWEAVLKYFYAVPFNVYDPIFGRDISFYIFSLPFIEFLIGLGFWIIIVSLLGVIAIYSTGGALAFKQVTTGANTVKKLFVEKMAKIHLSSLIGFLFILTALQIYAIRIPSLLYNTTGLFTGAGYTDINAVLPFLKILIVVAIVAAVLVLINAFKSNNRFAFIAFGSYFLTSLIGGWAYPAIIQKLVVLPNELARETPFIEHHIAGTKAAFGLDRVIERSLTGEAVLTIDDINNNQLTVQNIRLWDSGPLLDTFGQLQEIRTYYDFVSIDTDRYYINGELRQVLLSPRELNSASLPQRTFINERLTFTHGFGLTLSPVNEVAQGGLPNLFVKNLPPHTDIESLVITRPEIYFGELVNDWVVVNTKNKEFNYPSGEENVFKRYAGEGGVQISSTFRRILFALHFRSMKLFLSDDITSDSRIMYNRNITERVERALPFLSFDNDPYMVITEKGELKWIYDAYTTSDRFPYSELVANIFSPFPDSRINYIRNSVKVVIDAYDGKMRFYISDPEDPIIKTYAKIFQNAFLPISEMCANLRKHIRYPQDLFAYQTALYTIYHMDEARIFYNKEDQWEIPSIMGGAATDQMMRHMIMKLPGEKREEFILMIPFTPRGKDNMSAWMVARNDGEHYGELIVYRFPKQKLIFGPNQVMNRINQDADISRQLSLWDQGGSEVIRGSLLAIPIEESLIYVQPIYLRAVGGRIPELKRVIVAYGNRISMKETLDMALVDVFGGQVMAIEEREVKEIKKITPIESFDQSDLIKRAKNYFSRAMQARQQGDWALYGEKIKKLGEILSP